jgi:SAM-dependent methyltransferase
MSTTNVAAGDSKFAGSIPQLYERYLVPLIFQSYAREISRQVQNLHPAAVLELAAGTGVLTRALADRLPPEVSIIATDLNQPMLDQAIQIGTSKAVAWQQTDAMHLPFPDRSFDVVVCQFGVMFFQDKIKAYAEAKRVLRPGGHLVFSTWDHIENNDMVWAVCNALDALFPDNPPRFMHRVPHGYADTDLIARDLASAGLPDKSITLTSYSSHAAMPGEPAIAYCHGTPLRHEIEAKGPTALAEATQAAEAALEQQFGPGPIAGQIQAYVVIAPV